MYPAVLRSVPSDTFRALALLASIVAIALPPATHSALAQTGTGGTTPEVFIDIVDVDVVNLEVQVTDSDGNPIRGLTREDFVVLEDGEPVELTNFYEVKSARRVLPPEEAPPAAPEREVLVELPPDQHLHLAVVIDTLNMSAAGRTNALEQIRDELARVVRPDDRVMVAVLDNVPRVVQPFADNEDAVFAALDRIAESRVGNPALEAQRREIYTLLSQADTSFGDGTIPSGGGFQPLQQAQPVDYARNALALINAYAEQADLRMRSSFAAVNALVSSLSGLPGRKAVLLVSEGMSTNPALPIFEDFVSTFGPDAREAGVSSPTFASQRYDLSDVLQDVTRNAAASRVTFYTLDAARGRGLIGAEQARLQTTSGVGVLGQQDTLVQLAAATGGTAMLNAANVEDLIARMANDYSDYYSLGYTSDNSRDGDFHRIEVRVPRIENARVRHTEGYRAKSLEEEMGDRALSALILDVARNPLEVRVELGEEQAEKRNRYVVPVLVKVPVSKLALVPSESSHQGMVSIAVAVQDSGGGLSEPQRVEVPVDIPNEQLLNAMAREVGYGLNVLVRGGNAKLAIAVRDEVAAIESTLNLNIDVGGG